MPNYRYAYMFLDQWSCNGYNERGNIDGVRTGCVSLFWSLGMGSWDENSAHDFSVHSLDLKPTAARLSEDEERNSCGPSVLPRKSH